MDELEQGLGEHVVNRGRYTKFGAAFNNSAIEPLDLRFSPSDIVMERGFFCAAAFANE